MRELDALRARIAAVEALQQEWQAASNRQQTTTYGVVAALLLETIERDR